MRSEHNARSLPVGLQGLPHGLVLPAAVNVYKVWYCIMMPVAEKFDMLGNERVVVWE